MQTVPENKITIAKIADAVEAFRSAASDAAQGTTSKKKEVDLDSLLRMANLFSESTML